MQVLIRVGVGAPAWKGTPMLASALQAEVAAYVEAFTDAVDENGHRLVVRHATTSRGR